MTIIPAVMFLLGENAWKIPRWLDRILPSVDVEGSALEEKDDDDTVTGGPHESRDAVAAGRHLSMTVADQSPAAGKHEDRGETSDGGAGSRQRD